MFTRSSAVALLALVCLAGAVPVAQTAPTVDDLVAKNIQAKGGLEKVRSINSVKQTSQLIAPGWQASVVMYSKRPNLLRQEMTVNGQTVVNAFDGQTAWMVNPLAGAPTPTVISGPEAAALEDQSSFDGPLVDYRAKGYRLDLVGPEMIATRPVEHLRMTDRNGNVEECYLDADTGLEVRIVSHTPTGPLTQDLGDYRDVQGVKVPFSIRTTFNGAPQAEIRVSAVEFNVPVDDSFFKIPQR